MERWTPTGTGSNYTLSPLLEPLQDFKQKLIVLSNLENTGKGHSTGVAAMLSGTDLPNNGDPGQGDTGKQTISLDQLYAEHLGVQTPIASLVLALEGQSNSGSCNGGYPCAYQNNISVGGPEPAHAQNHRTRASVLHLVFRFRSGRDDCRTGATPSAQSEHS